jgi:hypothetical protein
MKPIVKNVARGARQQVAPQRADVAVDAGDVRVDVLYSGLAIPDCRSAAAS